MTEKNINCIVLNFGYCESGELGSLIYSTATPQKFSPEEAVDSLADELFLRYNEHYPLSTLSRHCCNWHLEHKHEKCSVCFSSLSDKIEGEKLIAYFQRLITCTNDLYGDPYIVEGPDGKYKETIWVPEIKLQYFNPKNLLIIPEQSDQVLLLSLYKQHSNEIDDYEELCCTTYAEYLEIAIDYTKREFK